MNDSSFRDSRRGRLRAASNVSGRSCRETALGFLARRSHTRRELSTKLVRKCFAKDEIDRVLDAFAEKGLVDDARTAGSIARSLTSRGKGSGRIRAELAAKGVSRADAEAALGDLDPEDEKVALKRLLERKARSLPAGLTPRARSKKLFDHLVRRGFAPGAVLEAIRTKGDPADDDD